MRSQVHSKDVCAGQTCAVHNPSHHMGDWPWSIRFDRNGMIERFCAHGVGHPDPDSVRWLEWNGEDASLVHGCCHERCCVPPQGFEPEPLFSVKVGQIWADNDPRKEGRTLEVIGIEGNEVVCVVRSNITEVADSLARGERLYTNRIGTTTRIKIRRLAALARGYRPVEENGAQAA